MTKLADLRDRIRSGSYTIDAQSLADALLRRLDEDHRPAPTPPSSAPQMGCS